MLTARSGSGLRIPGLIWGLALVTALTAILIGWRAQSWVGDGPDPYWFSAMGRSVARGEGLAAYGNLLHRRAPLYPLMIAAIYTAFGEHQILVKLVQALLFATMSVLAYDIGRRLYGPRTGLLAGVLCAIHPALLRYAADLHLETLFAFLLTASVWLSVRFYQRPRLEAAIAFGVVAALAALTKAVAVLYAPLFMLCWWLKRRRSSPMLAGRAPQLMVVAMLASMTLTIAPWTLRNYLVTGHFVPISTGLSDAFLRGYVFSKTQYITLRQPPYTDGENESNEMFRRICAAEGAVWEQDDYQTDQILNRAAKERLLASPGAFARKTLVGVVTFWYEMTTLKTSLFVGALALTAWLFAAVGLWKSRTEGQPVWLLLLPIFYFNLFLAPLLALGRYSVPVLPCLTILAAFGLDTIWQRLASTWHAREPNAPARR